jgi:peptide/nickel transport system permease protein
MTMPTQAALDPPADSAGVVDGHIAGVADEELIGRSPGQLAWTRFKRNRIALVCAGIIAFFLLVAAFAPVISALYGKNPYTTYGLNDPTLTDSSGMPYGALGGVSSHFWLGIEPGGLGFDVFTRLIYGIRTTLLISIVACVLSTIVGVALGLVQGYMGGKTDYFLGRFSDLMMAFPQQLFLIAFTPVIIALFVSPENATPTWLRGTALILVQVVLGWMGLGRLLRGMTLSLREREFIEAAKISGASPWRIIRKELMPNLGTTILVQSTLSLSGFVTTEAGLSFLGVGMIEPTPDWGRMFAAAVPVTQTDPFFLLVPGITLTVFTIAFNLLGDAVRDALDPKTAR